MKIYLPGPTSLTTDLKYEEVAYTGLILNRIFIFMIRSILVLMMLCVALDSKASTSPEREELITGQNYSADIYKPGSEKITEPILVIKNPRLNVALYASASSFSSAGEEIFFNIEVRNTGNVDITKISVADVLTGLEETIATLSPRTGRNYSRSYFTTQDDLEAGGITNTVTAIGLDHENEEVSADDTQSVTAVSPPQMVPQLELIKTASPVTYSTPGDVISFNITVRNTGDVALTNISVTDPLIGLNEIIPTLEPEAMEDFNGTYPVTQEDLNNGSIINIARASGADAENNQVDAEDSETVTAIADPQLTVTKSASAATFSTVGETITYTISVANTGNVTITNITVADPLVALNQNIASLPPGEEDEFIAPYMVTQADINSGSIVNTVTVTGTDTENNPVTDDATATINAVLAPELSVTNTPSAASFSSVGETLTYNIRIGNTGNVTITNIAVSDVLTGLSENIASLPPGDDEDYSAQYVVKQSDLNNGTIQNTVTASGRDSENNIITETGTATVTAALNPQLTLTKTASTEEFSSLGETISYTIAVENTGNVTLTGITVTDPMTGMNRTIASLTPGAKQEFTENYTVAQADLNHGSIVNTATATGNDPENNPVTDGAEVTVNASLTPGLSLTKTASTATFSSVGEEISYTIEVENTGNVIITGISVTDPLTGMDRTIASLAPGAKQEFTENYTVTQADLNQGSIVNTATATGNDPENNPVTGNDQVTVNASQTPGLNLTKSASATSFSSVGEEISYTIVVENTGNVTISNITVSDPLTGMNRTIASLAPGAEQTYTEVYTVTQADLNNGSIVNTATASGQDPEATTVSDNDEVTVNASLVPGLILTKSASAATFSSVGEEITYTIAVENTGNVTISNITVSDPLTGMNRTIASLAPGAEQTFTEIYTVTQADLNEGSIVNTATASGLDPENNTVATDDEVTVNASLAPGLSLTKTASPETFSSAGEEITYAIVIENTGNVTISNITVSDPLTGMNQTIASLAPGSNANFTEAYNVTQADINRGSVINTATASGQDPGGQTVSATGSATITAELNQALSISKMASSDTFSATGDVITYSISVENTGNVTLSNIVVTDPLTGMNQTIGTLSPGNIRNFNQVYTVTQADINEGSITNTATAVVGNISETASVTISAVQNPQLTVSKSASPSTYGTVGDEITYIIKVENTGNTTITNIQVTDPMTGMDETIVSLAPGASRNFTETYSVKQEDLDAGTISNTVTASNNTISETATATVTASQNPALNISKVASPESYSAIGDQISYTIIVSNTGNVTLTGVSIEDPLTGMNETISSLAPGASRTFNETYLVTVAGITAGKITNTVNVAGLAPDNSTVSASAIAEVTALSPPVANDDTSADHNSGDIVVVEILANDLLHDLSVALPILVTVDINLQAQGVQDELVVAGTGRWKYNSATGTLTFTPVPGFTTDPDPIEYQLTEKLTGLSDEAFVAIDYNEGEPFAINDNSTGHQPGSQVTLNILSNDRLSDGSPATTATVTIDLNPQAEGIQAEFVSTGEGTWNYNSLTGEVTFVPQAGFTTDPTPLIYNLTEILTGEDDQATITIGYEEQPPVAADDVSTENNPGDSVSINILMNDKLSDGTDVVPGLVQVDLNDAVSGIQNEMIVPGQGRWVYVSGTGLLTFIPESGFTVDPDLLQYQLIEEHTGLGSKATVTIQYNRLAPVATDDVSNGNNQGDIVTIPILSNDRLSNGAEALPALVTVDIDNENQGIQAELEVEGEGKWSYNAVNGILTFTPEEGFSSNPSPLAYTLIENLTELSAGANVLVNYNAEAPAAFDDTSNGNPQGEPVDVSILANDKMSDGSAATPGNVVVDLNQEADGIQVQLSVEGEGAWMYDAESGILTFTPLAGFTGNPAPVKYSLCDTDDNTVCSEASVYVYYEQTIPEAALALVKTGLYSSEEETVIYTFQVINIGNVEIEEITVSDERIGISGLGILPATLAPGDTGVATFIYELTEDDLNSGMVTNSASVTGLTGEGERVEDISGTAVDNDVPTVTTLNVLASISVEKETVFIVTEAIQNEVIDFRIIVENDGNVTLNEVLVSDPLTGFEHEQEQILPGESYTYTTSYTVKTEDEINGEFENIAYASGKAPDGSIVEDSSSVVIQVEGCELVIPNGFSPNDDGIQDFWRIQCIEKYPDARVEIFNRWGNRVFEMEGFGNVDQHGATDAWWDGYSSSKATFGSGKLPAGTYYYMLDLGDGSKPLSGFIFLNR